MTIANMYTWTSDSGSVVNIASAPNSHGPQSLVHASILQACVTPAEEVDR
jgi:hypothetical protein